MRFASLVAIAGALLAQRPNPGPSPRPDPNMESALKELIPLTTGVREDDHPAVAVRNGAVWVAWVSYSETEGDTRIYLRSFENERWTEPVEVSERPGDYHKPAIVVDDQRNVWVAWPAQVGGNWDIYGRVYRSGVWSKTERWTSHPGPDMSPQLAVSQGKLLLVWQSLRNSSLDILYRQHDGAWGPEGFVTQNAANDWEPVVAAGRDGAFYVAWDSFRGDYDVLFRVLKGSRWSNEMPVAASARLENRAALAVDFSHNRVWIAWEAGPENWAGDSAEGGLRARRDIGLAYYQGGVVYRAVEPEAALAPLAGKAGMQAPALHVGRDGGLRIFYRQPMNQNWLHVASAEWDGGAWSKPEVLVYSEGRIDQRVVLADLDDRVFACYPAGSSHNILYGKFFRSAGSTYRPSGTPVRAESKSFPQPRERHSFHGYQLVWGDLHRHTDISEDGGIIDGSLLDTMRYALDAAGLDFLGITDHTRYLPRRYNLWRIQQVTDLFYRPGIFAPLHAYERSQYSPWGHRNVVHLNRNYTPVPASYDIGDPGVDPNGLFAALRGKQALTIPHTSAWSNKQVSWDYHDPDIERVVEIYQGLRSTYEYAGAPDPANRAVYEKDSSNFVWNALERKLKMGFIASSDHRSTHISFAAVYAKGLDRASVFEGLRARRTYAATDKIILEFAIRGHVMGEEVRMDGKPELSVAIEGTGPIAQIDIIKNGTFAYGTKPGTASARFTFRDEDWDGKDAYYYVRVIQQDRNMAWASPIWVQGK